MTHAGHDHATNTVPARALMVALTLTLGFAGIEALAGWWAGSLALLSDAGHMVSDAASLGLAAFAAWAAKRAPSPRHSYGFGRAEVVAAFVNAAFMIGLLVNVAVAVVLTRTERTMNTRGALLHVMGDLLGSIAALLAGVVIAFTGWMPIDPLLSLFICALILFSSLRLLREALHALMEGTPLNLSLDEIGRAMSQVDRVRSVHDLHVWTLSSDRIALSAHLVIDDMRDWAVVLPAVSTMLAERYRISHATLQPETAVAVLRRAPPPGGARSSGARAD